MVSSMLEIRNIADFSQTGHHVKSMFSALFFLSFITKARGNDSGIRNLEFRRSQRSQEQNVVVVGRFGSKRYRLKSKSMVLLVIWAWIYWTYRKSLFVHLPFHYQFIPLHLRRVRSLKVLLCKTSMHIPGFLVMISMTWK